MQWISEHPDDAERIVADLANEQRREDRRMLRKVRSDRFWGMMRKVADIAAVLAAIAAIATLIIAIGSSLHQG